MMMVVRRLCGCARRHRPGHRNALAAFLPVYRNALAAFLMMHGAVGRRNAAVRVRALEAQTDRAQNGDGQLYAQRERRNRTGAGTPRHDLSLILSDNGPLAGSPLTQMFRFGGTR